MMHKTDGEVETRLSAGHVEGENDVTSLLYVTPIMPTLHGNGLAMRAAQVLLALATRHRVTLAVFPRYASPAGGTVPEEIRRACAGVFVTVAGDMPAALSSQDFDIVHVFRLGTIPFAEPWLRRTEGRGEIRLDLDDIESLTHRRIAALHRSSASSAHADAEEALAAEAETGEIAALARFDRVHLASAGDVDRLPFCGRARVDPLPNVLPLPEPPSAFRVSVDGPFVFLFVGTLGYFPNAEGLLWFGRDVLPMLRGGASRPFELHVVGSGWSPVVTILKRMPEVRMFGEVPEVRPFYERADAAIVPVRASGGTRIKVLEAFGLRRPVVGTAVGLEGIDASPLRHALIGDTPEAFAANCLRLMETPSLGEALTTAAYGLAEERHTPDRLSEIVAGWP